MEGLRAPKSAFDVVDKIDTVIYLEKTLAAEASAAAAAATNHPTNRTHHSFVRACVAARNKKGTAVDR